MPCKNKAHNIIAIDGPAGSGKSTVAKGLAKRLGFLYVDTGAMYRALTLQAIQEKVNLNDEAALSRLARRANIQLRMHNDTLKVMLEGEDISKAIRKQAITERVYFLARVPGVRREMVKLQRRLTQEVKGAVLEGRDIGTVVFPQAKYKFYLDAKTNERIERRYKEMLRMGQRVAVGKISKDIKMRDKSDMTRDVAPLVKAKDAVYIDTTDLNINDVVEKILTVFDKSG